MKNITNTIQNLKYLVVVVCSFVFVATLATPAHAALPPNPPPLPQCVRDPCEPPTDPEPEPDPAPTPSANTDEVKSGLNSVGGNDAGSLTGIIKNIINNILLYIIGAIAVVVIIIGGISYVTSGGDQSKVTSAKNTILYAVVGLVIAIMAFAIVNFILANI